MSNWTPICDETLLIPDTGLCAKIGEAHVAIFKSEATGELYAFDNVDPFTKASVLSRGLIGEAAGEIYVASPLLKQKFRLKDGLCLDNESIQLTCYPIRVLDGIIEIGA